jgi:hypothetical protein
MTERGKERAERHAQTMRVGPDPAHDDETRHHRRAATMRIVIGVLRLKKIAGKRDLRGGIVSGKDHRGDRGGATQATNSGERP